jgi:hypothetical protein
MQQGKQSMADAGFLAIAIAAFVTFYLAAEFLRRI